MPLARAASSTPAAANRSLPTASRVGRTSIERPRRPATARESDRAAGPCNRGRNPAGPNTKASPCRHDDHGRQRLRPSMDFAEGPAPPLRRGLGFLSAYRSRRSPHRRERPCPGRSRRLHGGDQTPDLMTGQIRGKAKRPAMTELKRKHDGRRWRLVSWRFLSLVTGANLDRQEVDHRQRCRSMIA